MMARFGHRRGTPATDTFDEESLLVERAKVDGSAFGLLYDRHVDGVYRFVYSRLRNRQAAELGEASRMASAGAGPEETALGRVEQSRVWAFIDELPPAQQTALALRLGHDMATVDIAYVMGKSEGAVKVLVHRGLSSLRARLNDDGALEHLR